MVCAQDLEDFHIEFNASVWLHDSSGTVQSGVAPVDLQTDLGIEQGKPQFFGKLTIKPSRRNGIIIEGTPYRLRGSNTITRQFAFGGRTYTFQDQVTSAADMDYVFGGYQFDVVSRPRGHAGFLAGVAYVNATGTIRSETRGFTTTETQSFPMPLVGLGARGWLARFLSVSGEVKGMDLGSYGHFMQGAVRAGVSLGRHFTVQAGYMAADADIHRQDATRGIAPRFAGVVFGVEVRQ